MLSEDELTIEIPMAMFGRAGDRMVICHVTERPSPYDALFICSTPAHPDLGYTVSIGRSGRLHQIGWVDPSQITGV